MGETAHADDRTQPSAAPKAALSPVALLREQVAATPGNPGLRVRLGIQLKTEGRLSEAETVLREVIARFPRNERARNELREISLKQTAAEPAATPAMPPSVPRPPDATPTPQATATMPKPQTTATMPEPQATATMPKPQTTATMPAPQATATMPAPQATATMPAPPATAMMPEQEVVDRSGFDLLFAAPSVVPPGTWKGSGANLTVPGETALTGEPAGMRIRLRRPFPRSELIVAGCIVLLLTLMWQLRGYAPRGYLMQRSAEITLPSGTPPVLQTAPPPAATIAVSQAGIPAPPAVVISQPALAMPPPSIVEASPSPALPGAAPANILILYRPGEPGAALEASRLAGRLRAAGSGVTVQAKAVATPGQAEIGYIFAEDRASALAISAQLDGRFGPVRQVAQRGHGPGNPGAVTIALP